MNKNTKLTSLDSNQYTRREHEEEYDAKRVFLVNKDDINIQINEEKIIQAIKESFNTPTKQFDYEIVEVLKKNNLLLKLQFIFQVVCLVALCIFKLKV